MFQKNDPTLTYLNPRGYNVVRYPSPKLKPLGVIGRSGSDKRFLGMVDRIWKTNTPLPVLGEPEPAPGVAGSMSCETDLTFGLSFLAKALAIFGASAPSLDASYKNAKSVQFTFSGVTTLGIDPFDIGDYFASGTMATGNPVLSLYFNTPDCDTFLITEVLQATTMTVTAKTESGETVNVDVPAIQGIVGAKVGVKAGAAGTGDLTYEGQMPVPVGFRAYRFTYVNGKLQLEGVAASGENAFGDEDDAGPAPTVFAEATVDLDYEDAAAAAS